MSLLEVHGVTQRFGELTAVNQVSLNVEEGELHAIIGPNGAGKTTFFNMISGFHKPTGGRIVFDGGDVTDLPPHQRVGLGMARTFQITEVFPELSVRDNLRIAVEVTEGLRMKLYSTRRQAARTAARVDELLETGGLTANADRHVGELSHGDQRSTEIMMALFESARKRQRIDIPLKTRVNPLMLMVENGDLPVEWPGAYERRARIVRGEQMSWHES